jgi:hypothetical protein
VVYTWWAKGNYWLATTGSVTLSGAPVTAVAMGLQPAGDCDNNNQADSNDLSILRAGWGPCPSLRYDGRADFTGDCRVDSSDETLLKANFGQSGAPPP